MANKHFIVNHDNVHPNTGGAYWGVWICDTYAGRPVTGLVVGEIGIMLDTGRIHFASSTTAWTATALFYDVGVVGGVYIYNSPTFASGHYIISAATSLYAGPIIPDDTGNFVLDGATQTLSNKTLQMGGADVSQLYSGTYTPTFTNVANLTGSTAYEAQYMRVGNVVTVSGILQVDPTLTATSTSLRISLPVASALTSSIECCGVAFCNNIAGQGAAIYGEATSNDALMQWVATDTTNQSMTYTFTYRVL